MPQYQQSVGARQQDALALTCSLMTRLCTHCLTPNLLLNDPSLRTLSDPYLLLNDLSLYSLTPTCSLMTSLCIHRLIRPYSLMTCVCAV